VRLSCTANDLLRNSQTRKDAECQRAGKNIKDMNKDSTKDTAKRKNEDKQAEAKLQGLEQENTKLQEEIFKLTKDKAARGKGDEKASKQVKTEQD